MITRHGHAPWLVTAKSNVTAGSRDRERFPGWPFGRLRIAGRFATDRPTHTPGRMIHISLCPNPSHLEA